MIMEYNTSELCNVYADLIDVLEPIFSNYGGRSSVGGKVVTIKCFESNGLIHKILQTDGNGKVLVIDGGGSTRRAIIDIEMGELAGHAGSPFRGPRAAGLPGHRRQGLLSADRR